MISRTSRTTGALRGHPLACVTLFTVLLLAFGLGCARVSGGGLGQDNDLSTAPPSVCLNGLTDCDGTCTDTQSSLLHCGVCGRRCFRDQVCRAGHCSGTSALSPEELHQALGKKDFFLLNVRVPSVGIIPGTDASCSNEEPDRLAETIGPDRHARVVVYCRTVPRSLNAIDRLRERGYTSISYLDGGVLAWAEAGYALE